MFRKIERSSFFRVNEWNDKRLRRAAFFTGEDIILAAINVRRIE